MIFYVASSFISGILFALFIELLLIYQWWIRKPIEKPHKPVTRHKVKNPQELVKYLTMLSDLKETEAMEKINAPETCIFLNIIFSFLWREWKDSAQMKRFFMSKITREFSDLIGAKPSKGIIEEITINSYSFGDTLPIIKDVQVIGIRSRNPEEVPDEIDLALDITYSGGFYMSADFALAFNKSVYLSIKIVKITGKVKLSFKRYPASHWSFSFFEDPEPEIELDAESRFEGKAIQQLTSLLVRHFKKVIHRKYILPNYVIRYKPFMMEKIPQDEQTGVYVHNSQITGGSLCVTILGCSRLPFQKKSTTGHSVFCSLSVDASPFSERNNVDPTLWPILECQVIRGNERKIGLTFHEVNCTGDVNGKRIVVDSINTDSPVGYSTLKEGDVILEINGKSVIDAKQVTKLIKTSNKRLSILVKRPPSYMPLTEAKQLSQKIKIGGLDIPDSCNGDDNNYIGEEFFNVVMPLINMSNPQSHLEQNKVEVDSSYDRNSHTSKKYVSEASPIAIKTRRNPDNEEIFVSASYAEESEKYMDNYDTRTKSVKISRSPQWNETFDVSVEKDHKYLNVLVWYTVSLEPRTGDENIDSECQTKDLLLGFVTIPLTDIAVQCLQTGDRFHQQEYVLVSTAYDKVVASRSSLVNHPGLNRVTCGGDITLSFVYKPSFDADTDCPVTTKVYTSQEIDKDHREHAEQLNEDFDVSRHDFVDTQFHHATTCDFCSKKIWTKSAYHCRSCNMACHKKCLQRAQMYTQCYSHLSQSKNDDFETEHEKIKLDFQTLREHGVNPMDIIQTRSMDKAIDRMKMNGKKLYPDLSSTNRKLKLEEMVNTIQQEIDEVNEDRIKLYEMRKLRKPPLSLSKIDNSIVKSEEKRESLKLLMLQFCSGLENCECEREL